MFSLSGEVILGGETLPNGVIMLPVHKIAETIVLSPGAQLAGIRFRPAISYGVLGKHCDKLWLLPQEEDHLYSFYKLYAELEQQKDDHSRVDALQRWTDENLNFSSVIPDTLKKALESIEQGEHGEHEESLGRLCESLELSQRQIERLFRRWLKMTPKHYQRILRIKNAVDSLRSRKNVDLADVAQQFGFSDQAHMTREFRNIARVTPGRV